MKSKFLATVFAAVMLLVSMAGPGAAAAAGSASISGNAWGSVYHYRTARTVTNPDSPGPEVAFNQSYGPAGLRLGTHGCNQVNGYNYAQTPGVWEPVLIYPYPITFCLYTLSDSGTGPFSGTLAWD